MSLEGWQKEQEHPLLEQEGNRSEKPDKEAGYKRNGSEKPDIRETDPKRRIGQSRRTGKSQHTDIRKRNNKI